MSDYQYKFSSDTTPEQDARQMLAPIAAGIEKVFALMRYADKNVRASDGAAFEKGRAFHIEWLGDLRDALARWCQRCGEEHIDSVKILNERFSEKYLSRLLQTDNPAYDRIFPHDGDTVKAIRIFVFGTEFSGG